MRKKILSAFLLLFFCIFLSFFYNDTEVLFKMRKLPIYSVSTQEKIVAITFDTSWGTDYTDEILDILNKYDIKATFFIIGKWAEEFPDKVKKIYKNGNELGNHSYIHPDMIYLTPEKIINEINLTEAEIFQLTGETTKLFRCPSGSYNDLVIKTVENTGHYPIQWSIDSVDWKEDGAEVEYGRVVKKIENGSIILFHNNAKYTPENLAKIIIKLQKTGYKFVKVSDLIYKNNYILNNEGKQIHG